MVRSVDSLSFDPGRRFAQAQFGRWFGRYFLAAVLVFVLGAVVGALLILPHGVLELGAFFLVAGLGFRVTHRLINYLRRKDETLITGQEIFEIGVLLVVTGWVSSSRRGSRRIAPCR